MRARLGQIAPMAAWSLLNLFFAVYLLQAERIYPLISGTSYAVKCSDGFSLRAKGVLPLVAVFDYPPVNNKFIEGKEYRGEFSTIAKISDRAQVRVFFRAADSVYEVLENRRSFWAHAKKIAVNMFASTSGLENGV